MTRWILAGGLTGLLCLAAGAAALEPPTAIIAEGHDRRIDVVWQRVNDANATRYAVYRAESAGGPWERLTAEPYRLTVYSDYLGANDVTRYYRVTTLPPAGDETAAATVKRESAPTPAVSATTRAMTEDELLESVQKATFRYFWDFAHPVSGLAREGLQHPPDTVTMGGSGFGMIAIMIGAERGWITREQAAAHLLKSVRFLGDKAVRFKGAWAHWYNGRTGEPVAFFNEWDNGGDLVETAFLIQGMLTVAQYFDGDTATERELRERIDTLWREVEWDWYLRLPGNLRLFWHWSPKYGWRKNHPIGDHFNECQITYILGLASPTHPLPGDAYHRGWLDDEPSPYPNGKTFYGMTQPVGYDYGGPLFFTHYSYLGLDPRAITDRYTNYYTSNQIISRINRAYCIDNPKEHAGYSELAWGLTASFNPWGYGAHSPLEDNGTITPTAAIGAMPYTPEESIATLKHFYYDLGDKLWGPLGFWDALHPGEDWVADTFIAIDQGPIVVMIENYRTQLPWRMFMRNEFVIDALRENDLLSPGYQLPVPKLRPNLPHGGVGEPKAAAAAE
jgi:hypothetical protein